MPGFFYNIRGLFQEKYSGRYIAFLLRELARHEPEQFALGLELKLRPDAYRALKSKKLRVECEWSFKTAHGLRFADLAILSGDRPVVIFEIKEDDIGHTRNAAQLRDYVMFIKTAPKGQEPEFVHISRFAPGAAEHDLLRESKDRVSERRYRRIYEVLNNPALKVRGGPITRMLCDYLEDIGVASYEIIHFNRADEGKSLAFVLTQLLGFPHFHGLGKLQSDKAVDDLPKFIRILFGNLEILGDWLKDRNRQIFQRRFTRKVLAAPEFDLGQLRRKLNLSDSTSINELPGKRGVYVKSGSVYFYALGKMRLSTAKKGGDYLYLELGYRFDIARGKSSLAKKNPMHAYMYASVFGKEVDEGEYFKPTTALRKFPDERKAQSALSRCIDTVRRQLVADDDVPLRYKSLVKRISF